jgi:hypothetical protein
VKRHRLDDFLEYGLTKQGRENVALAVLATSCLAGIFLLNRVA